MPASSSGQSKRPDSGRGTTCKATRTNGKQCKAIAGSTGLCAAHRDPERMRDLGRRGGQGRVRGVDDAVAASELGRAKLVELSQHENPTVAIAASRALFSYSPQRPPADEDENADLASEDALLARLEKPETWTPRLREAIDRAAVMDPEVKRKVDAFVREMGLRHGTTVAGLEEVGLVRVHPDSATAKLRDAALEAKREEQEAT